MCLLVCLTWAPTCGFMFLSRDVSASLQFFLFLLTCFCHSPGVVTPVLLPYCSQETLLGTFNNSVHPSFPSCFVFSHHLSLSLYFMIRLSQFVYAAQVYILFIMALFLGSRECADVQLARDKIALVSIALLLLFSSGQHMVAKFQKRFKSISSIITTSCCRIRFLASRIWFAWWTSSGISRPVHRRAPAVCRRRLLPSHVVRQPAPSSISSCRSCVADRLEPPPCTCLDFSSSVVKAVLTSRLCRPCLS